MDKYDKAENELDNYPSRYKGAKLKAFRSLVNGHLTMWVGYGHPFTAQQEWSRHAKKFPKVNERANRLVTETMRKYKITPYNWNS